MADPRFTPEPLTDATGQPWAPPQGGGEIGGDRHYTGSEASAVGPWKCPACGIEQVSRLELGCPSCGSGKPGYHKGVDPVRPPAPLANQEQGDVVDYHFTRWLEGRMLADVNPAGVQKLAQILREAYRAGWVAAAVQQAHRMAQIPERAPTTTGPILTPEGKERRTLIAALRHFRDQVLAEDPEEVAAGEWCSAAETDQLIAGLERET